MLLLGRYHLNHLLLPPDRIIYSRCCALEAQTVQELSALGYTVEPSSWEFGDMQVIERTPDGGLAAAADPRGRGQARVIELTSRTAKPVEPRSRPAAVAE